MICKYVDLFNKNRNESQSFCCNIFIQPTILTTNLTTH